MEGGASRRVRRLDKGLEKDGGGLKSESLSIENEGAIATRDGDATT